MFIHCSPLVLQSRLEGAKSFAVKVVPIWSGGLGGFVDEKEASSGKTRQGKNKRGLEGKNSVEADLRSPKRSN